MTSFLLDHDVPDEVARVLRAAEYNVACLRDLASPVSTDEEVFSLAIERNMLLVTCNRDDFLELAKTREFPGLIILIRRKNRHLECAHLLRLLEKAGPEGWSGNILFA